MSAQLLLIGPDAWPFDDDKQAKLVAAIKGDLQYSTGRFPDPLKYQVTDVRSSSGSSAPPGRKLLQARVALAPLLTWSLVSAVACAEKLRSRPASPLEGSFWACAAQRLRVIAVPHRIALAFFRTGKYHAGVRVFAENVSAGCLLNKALTGACALQAMNSLVTVQIATGDTNLVSNVRLNLVNDVQSGAILVRCHCARLHACAPSAHRLHVRRVVDHALPT